MLARTRRASRAYGRVATTFSCARRSFDAATIFIAFVICCVDFTARMRRRMSMSDAISGRHGAGREVLAVVFERRLQHRLQIVVQNLLLGDRGQHAGMMRFEVPEE